MKTEHSLSPQPDADTDAEPRPAQEHRRFTLGLLAITALAVALRALAWRDVFRPDGVLLWGGDSYYHMRRIWYSVTHFPAVLEHDPFLNFPAGGQVPWPPGYDWSVALLLRAFVGAGDAAAAEVAAAWVPVLFAAASVWVVARVGSRLAGVPAGLGAAALLALLPASFAYSRLGNVDHHAAVAFLGALLLSGLLSLVARNDAGPRTWPGWAAAMTAGLLYTWPGSLLHLGLAQLALVVWTLRAADRALAAARASRLAAAHLIAALALAPYAWGRSFGHYGEFTAFGLTSFQPLYFAAVGVALAATAFLWRSMPLGATPRGRSAAALGMALLGLALALVGVPGLAQSLLQSAGWFTGGERFLDRISENRPLLGAHWNDPRDALRMFGGLFFAFPLAWLVLWVRRGKGLERVVLAGWSLFFGVATLLQIRFMNTFVVAFALVVAVALAEAWRGLGTHAHHPRLMRAGLVVATLALLQPAMRELQMQYALTHTQPAQLRQLRFREAARYIAAHSPERASEDDYDYAVLCAWGMGHLVRYYAQRPLNQDNFGPYAAPENVAAAASYYAESDEAKALEHIAALRTRYVIVDARGSGVAEPPSPTSLVTRMLTARGSERHPGIAALAQHRLVFEASGPDGPVRVFERVPGVALSGQSAPGAWVEASLRLRAANGSFAYRNSVRAGADGRYALTLPYPTQDFGSDVRPLGDYAIESLGQRHQVAVSEREVSTAAVIAGPRFATISQR